MILRTPILAHAGPYPLRTPRIPGGSANLCGVRCSLLPFQGILKFWLKIFQPVRSLILLLKSNEHTQSETKRLRKYCEANLPSRKPPNLLTSILELNNNRLFALIIEIQ